MKTKLQYIYISKKCSGNGNANIIHLLLSKSKILQIAILYFTLSLIPASLLGQASASFNYTTQTGTLENTYSWIDCSGGTSIVSGDDITASISWPFNFAFYDNNYSPANNLSVATNGFIRLDGVASTIYSTASGYNLSSTSTTLGQIIAMSVYDGKVGDNDGWVKYLVTGTAPNRILTIEYNNHEIDYNDRKYANIQVSFYETSNKIVLKLGIDNISKSGVDMGIHSGVNDFFNKWQEVLSGTNNTWIEYTPGSPPPTPTPPAASWNYDIQTGVTGTNYSWIDCSTGNAIVSGDDAQYQIAWPFEFNYYDNSYTTSHSLSVTTNGFIRLDGIANANYLAASAYDLTSTATNLGQIIAMDLYDGKVGDNGGWIRSLVTGTAPERIFTIEYNNHEVDYNDRKYVDVQISFYESTNKIVLKLGIENINKASVDMGLHSGVTNYFHKWQEVSSSTNSTWIEYTPPYVEVNATAGSSLANYFTLKSAFDKINDGTHQGEITIKIKHSTTESAAAVLNGSGTGNANYAYVNIYPTESGLSISGNLASPLIDLNGADNVTIDGRVNATGTVKDLNIINTSTASVTGTSAIRFVNDASNNIVKYCTIKSSETVASSGIIFFDTTTESNGNDDNIIDNNNITNAADANRPVNAIYSLGIVGKDNSENIISNNNIYDFFNHSTASNGIFLSSNTSEWTINGNSFYESASFTPTGTVTYNVIEINNVSGNGFVVTNNYIGGSAVQCGGTAWTKTNSTSNLFRAIYLEVGTTVASSVQNNTIRNFSWSNSGIANWIGIKVVEGDINIGTTTGNTIGATTGTGSISVTGGTNGQSIFGLRIKGTGEINCNNNTIGSITGFTSSTYSTHIYGIELAGYATASITNNTIGSTSTASSIYASSTSSANQQKVYGIYSLSSGTTEIHENTISNLKNNTSNTAVGTNGLINGIYVSAGTNTICHNTVNDISIANASTSSVTPSAVGVFLNAGTEVQSIENNTIYNISNTFSSFTGSVVGLYTINLAESSAGKVDANFIHSISVSGSSTGAKIYGIYNNSDGLVHSNNIITLGGIASSSIYGIFDEGSSDKSFKYFFNSIYISGTNSGSEESYALRYNTNSNTRDLRNNILFNARSGGTGGHYAIYYGATGGTFTADYNDYFVTGTGGILGYYGGNQATLALFKTATSQDANSLNTNPNFTSAGGTNSSDYITSATLQGITGTGVTTDYDGITRDNPPKMGALELSLDFVWEGTTSTDFATTTNWKNGAVPPNGADISFATTPTNDCDLDQNRTLKNITNTSGKKLVVNAKQLTLTGNIVSATANQINASTALSVVIFAGLEIQSIPSGVFENNTIDALTLNNSRGLTQNGDLILSSNLTLTIGSYIIGANTLTINGSISTTSGTLTGGNTSNIVFGGSGASTTLPNISLNNLTLNRANGLSLGGPVSVAGTLALTAGTLTLEANTFTISGNSPTRVSGNIDASNTSATMELTNSSNITCPGSIFVGNINNFTIKGAGLSSCCSCTINGILNLQSANPSSIMGALDMGSGDTLTMGENATTIGIGDVTGIVRRAHTFTANTEYTFGSQYTTFTFVDANTKPTWICVKIGIGTVPGWNPWTPVPNGKVKRLYQVSGSDNSSTSQANINMRYLFSELDATYNDESKLVFWHKKTDYAGGLPHEHGKANQDFTNQFIGVVGLTFGAASTTNLDDSQIAIAYSVLTKNTWKGEVTGHETEWEQAHNWTAGAVPVSTEDVLIPGGLTYYPSLTASANAVAKSIEIEIGASITANSYNITVSGSGGAWINQGIFYPGTGTVTFNHGVSTEIVTIAGITNLYNIAVGENTSIAPVQGCVIRIAGTASATPTSKADWSAINSTIEWNGTNQNILNPTGLSGNSGYYNLILSGSGAKTMPGTALNVIGDFTLDGTATATAASEITIGGDLSIDDGTTFATGAFDHSVKGNFDNNGTFTVSAGKTITLNGDSAQSILGTTASSFEKLTINNTAGVNIYTDVTINNTLALTIGNLNVGATTLTINGDASNTSGFINVTTLSSLTFGGTTTLSPASSLFYTVPVINNLTVNRTGGVVCCCDFTVNGILNLQSVNPSSIIGTLDMSTNTLTMGENATTIGIGDVTGIIRREHIFTTNTEYSFGSQYTTIDFIDGNLTPTWISIKVSIGTVSPWSPWSPSPNGKVKRLYKLACSNNSSIALSDINMRYLISEMDATYNDEHKLIFWHKKTDYAGGAPHEHGKATQDLTNHNIGVIGLIFGSAVTTDFDDSQVTMAYSVTSKNTWKGEVAGHETEWEQTQNWTSGIIPLSTDEVLIPGGLSNYPSLTASANAVVGTIEINPGASIIANSYNITISGSGGAWINEGTFTPGTGTVTFNHGVSAEIVTVAGITNFYNVQIGANTTLVPVPGCTFRIAGAATGTPSSQADWSAVNSTVEWNGADQNINNPQGIGGNTGYYNLILSGNGTKTMPSSAMTIHGNFSTSGTAAATAADSLYLNGNITIGSGSTFATGSYTHLLEGNFENNGTFTGTSGGTLMFIGTAAQTISGTSTTTFDGLCIDNIFGVTQEVDVNVNNVLSFCDGVFTVGSSTLGINGTLFNPSGNIGVTSLSSLSFGGTNAITLNNNLFNSNPTINNLTINRSGGVTLGNESMTVNGTMTLTAGTFTIAANTLTLSGNSPTRTSGNIDASNTSALISFTNTAAITLPASVFSDNVNNMTLNGSGGITSGSDFTMNGTLNLQSANPSSVKGILDMNNDTLFMGAAATTVGIGDVIGIVKREHTFENSIEYSFGNQFTTFNFYGISGSTKPTWISCRIIIGTTPLWRSVAVKRYYSFAQAGGDDRVITKLHYLDSELNAAETDESRLVFWGAHPTPTYENNAPRGRAGYNESDNWLTLEGMAINMIGTSTLDDKQLGISYTNITGITWVGTAGATYSGDWSMPGNWAGGVPTTNDSVLIPNPLPDGNFGYPDKNSLTSIHPSVASSIEIESGASLGASDYDITVYGDSDAWVNNGTFTQGTATVTFANGDETETVTISGTTNFYNLSLSDKTNLQPATNCIIRIEGKLSADISCCILDCSTNTNTVEYNGSEEQNIINPGGVYGYHNLSFTGNGTKILPETTVSILGNLTINSTVSATGNTVVMAGTNAQTIGGANATTFNNLTIDNATGVTLTNTALTAISGSLLINSGKIFEIAAAQKLSVTGTITNSAGNSGFILNSDATGTASLLHNSDNIAATVKRYISGAAEDWHFLSTPVSNQEISGDWLPSGTYGNGTGYDLYAWNEATNCWIYKLNTTETVNWTTIHPSANFVTGRGYLYSVEASNPTKSFAGNLNNGSIVYGLTIDGSEDLTLQGFNLIGNLYSSSIDWMASSGWTRNNLVSSGSGNDMWIWNPEASNYGVYNSGDASGVGTNSVTRYIAPMQGFFVRAESAGNMEATNDIRVHDATTTWKSAHINLNQIAAVVYSESDSTYDEVQLLFGYPENIAGAAKLFSPVVTAPSLYLPLEDANYTIRYLTDTITNPQIPIMLKPGRNGNYSIDFNFDFGDFSTIVLEDCKTCEFIDLNTTHKYQFTASTTDNLNRFVLHFGEVKTDVNQELPAIIYSTNGKVVIDLTAVNEITDINIVDVLGRTILQKNVDGKTIHNLPVNVSSQILIVFAKTKNAIVSKKVFVSKH